MPRVLDPKFTDFTHPVALCVKVENPLLSTVLGAATSLDEKITFGGVTYNPRHGGQFETIDSELGAVVPQTTWYGFLDELTPQDLRYFWSGAEMTYFRIIPKRGNGWTFIGDPDAGADVRFFGDLASITLIDDVHFAAEFRDLMQRARGDFNQHISVDQCQNRYGVMTGNLGCPATPNVYSKTVLAHTSTTITIAGTPAHLVPGKVEWTSGPNTGFRPIRIISVAVSSGNSVLTLDYMPPFIITDGESLRVTDGCDRLPDTCKDHLLADATHDAGWGFNGHTRTPQQDKINVLA